MTLEDCYLTRVDQRIKCEGERIFCRIATYTRYKFNCILIYVELILDTAYLLGRLQCNRLFFLKLLLSLPRVPLKETVSPTVVYWKLFICVKNSQNRKK